MRCNNCSKIIPETSTVCPYCNLPVDPNAKPVVNFGEINDLNYDSKKFDIKAYVAEPKNKSVIMMGIGVIALVVIIFIALIASMFSGKSKIPNYQIYTNVIDSFVEYLDDNFISTKYSSNGKYDLKLEVNDKNYSLDGTYGYDIKNKLLKIDGKMQNDFITGDDIVIDYESLDYSIYLKDDALYIGSNEIFDTTVFFPIQDETGLLKTKKYDIYSLVHGVIDSFEYTLKVMNYINSKESINYRGNKISVKKVSLVLDNKNKAKFFENFYQNLIDDSNFVNEMSRITDKRTNEVIKILENYKTTAEYKYQSASNDKTEFNIYYSSKKVYRIEVVVKEENKDEKYVLDIGDTKYYFDYYKDSKNEVSMTLALTTKEIEAMNIREYEITYDTDKYVSNISLSIEEEKTSTVKKREITDYKSIRDLTDEDIRNIKINLEPYYKDVKVIDSIQEMFKEKCDSSLNCVCEDNEDECSCTYKSSIIKCPRELVVVPEMPTEGVDTNINPTV